MSSGRGRRLRAWGGARSLLRRGGLVALLTLGSLVACDEATPSGLEPGDGDGLGNGTGGALAGAGGSSSGLPPERELEETFRSPVVVGRFLFTANPDSNRVARVDARTLDIETFEAGFSPTYLSGLPEGATKGGALVLNTRSRDASLYFLGASAEAPLVSKKVPVHPGASAWAVGVSGRFAVAWSEASAGLLEADDGHQDVTVLGFARAPDEISVRRLSVGFRPTEVFVNATETRAFVVCEPGITVLALGENPTVEREIFLPVNPGARDVEFSADGEVALVRREGSAEVLVVDTRTDERRTLALPKVVTDLDVALEAGLGVAVLRADGQSEAIGAAGAGATEPDESLIALFDLARALEEDFALEYLEVPGIVGSVSLAKDGSSAALFSTATGATTLYALELAGRRLREVDVRGAVDAVLVADDGSFAVSLLRTTDAALPGAFALVPLKAELPARISGTAALPVAVALDPVGRGALVTTDGGDAGASMAYLGRFPELSVDAVPLASRPLAVGVVPSEGRAFVSQEHPEGRLSFVELDTASTKTLTGFELERKVVR